MDYIRPTPRNPIYGLLADELEKLYSPTQTQQMQGLMKFLMVPEVSKTMNLLAYDPSGRSLFTGAGGLGGTTKPRPEVAEAALAVAPIMPVAGRAARGAARLADVGIQTYGPKLEKAIEPLLESQYAKGGMARQLMEDLTQGTRSNVYLEKKNPLVGQRYEVDFLGNLAPKEPTQLEQLKDASLMILPWDSTTRNMRIRSISDELLPTPVTTQGGQDFARALENIKNEIGGASGEAIAKRIQKRVIQAQKENLAAGGSGDVYMLPSTMSIYAENFSTMPTEILLQLIKKADVDNKTVKQLNEQVRNFRNTKGEQNFKDFKGIDTIEGQQQLFTGEGVNDTAGELRKAFVNRMYLKENQQAFGFNEEDLVNSVTDAALRGFPRGYTGNTIIKANPEGILTPSSHKSYSTNFPGTYAGSLEGGLLGNVPVEILLPKSYGRIEQEFAGKAGDMRSNVIGALEKRNAGISDFVDQEMIDNYYKFLEREKLGLLD